MNYLKKVEEFQRAFKAPVLPHPQLIDKERAALRIRLIQEELDELKEAVENDDLVEVADALCDLQYVLSGAVLEFGMKDRFDKMFDEVHQSNISKVCQTPEETNMTCESYHQKGIEVYIEPLDNTRALVFRKSDNKILKSINYSPADLAQFFEEKVDCPECSANIFQNELNAYEGVCQNCFEDKYESK